MLNDIQKAYDYARDVRSGKLLVGNYVKLAVERYYRDLDEAEKKGFYFDEKAAQKALLFFELLCFTKGKWQGKPFELQPWQCFLVANIFGWKREEDGLRRFTESYVEIPKKNGKTELAAGIGLYMLMMDGEPGAEVYAAAYTRDQATICFDGAKSMATKSRHIKKRLTVLTYSLYNPSSESKMSAVSHDAANTEGKNSHCVLFDEYHVHKTDDVKTSLRSGMAARTQPLFFTITTAGSNKQGPCFRYRAGCIQVLDGKIKRDNMFCMIYGLDKDDNWEDPAMWEKANPNYGVSVQPQFLMGEYEKAKTNGREEVEFKTKHLNEWVDADVTWIASEIWKSLSAKVGWVPPQESVCYAGLDLANTSDICAFSVFFPDYNHFMRYLYVPKNAAKNAVRSGIDYIDWVNGEFLIEAGDRTVDYDVIKRDMEMVADIYDLKFVGFDRWGSKYFKETMNEVLGTTFVPGKGSEKGKHEPIMQDFGQGFGSMSTPTKAYEKMILDGKMQHDGNPVMDWMLSNVVITTDPAGNAKPDKGKSKDKIDGIVADIMAYGEYLAWNWETKYEDDIAVW